MSLIALLIMIVVVGLLIWAVQSFLPLSPTLKNLVCFLLVVIAVVWLLGGNVGRIHL